MLESHRVIPGENGGCPVPMLEAGGPFLGLKYSLAALFAPDKKLLLSVMLGVNKVKHNYKLRAVYPSPAQTS